MAKRQDTIQLLDVTLLQPNPFQPRNKILKEELEELSQSIKIHGVLEPLVVAHTPAGYQIIAGERRWRASQIAGLKEVPVIIKDVTRREMLEMALIENVQRVDLSALERAHSFKQLQQDFNLGVMEIANRISKSHSYVSNTLRLLDLPDAIKDGLVGGQITEGHARALMGIDTPSKMIEVYKTLLTENATVRRAEELARIVKSRTRNPGKLMYRDKPVYEVDDVYVKQWEEKLTKLIRANAKVKLSRSSTQTKITITLKGSLERTQADLEKIMMMTDPKEFKSRKAAELKEII